MHIIIQIPNQYKPNPLAQINCKSEWRVWELIDQVGDEEVSETYQEVYDESQQENGYLPHGFSSLHLLLVFYFFFCH